MNRRPVLVKFAKVCRGAHPGVSGHDHVREPWHSANCLTIGMIVKVSALSPSNSPSEGPVSIIEQAHDDLRVDATLLALADLAQLVFLLGLEVERGDAVVTRLTSPLSSRG